MESLGGMILKGKTREIEKNLFHCHFVHNKYHMD
jgi:hypothetical protein